MFHYKDICYQVSKLSTTKSKVFMGLHISTFCGKTPIFYCTLLVRFTAERLAKFGSVSFADFHVQSLAMQQNAEFTKVVQKCWLYFQHLWTTSATSVLTKSDRSLRDRCLLAKHVRSYDRSDSSAYVV